jgi:hypothetical protein
VQRLAWDDRLPTLLVAGRAVPAVGADGRSFELDVEGLDDRLVHAHVPSGSLGPGQLLTARAGEPGRVVFLQLVVEAVARASGTPSDLVSLRVADGVAVPSERSLERSAFTGEARLRRPAGALPVRVLDLSPVGVRLQLREPLPVGDVIDLELASGSDVVRLQARVVRTSEGADGHELAAEVVALAPSDWIALERLLAPAG